MKVLSSKQTLPTKRVNMQWPIVKCFLSILLLIAFVISSCKKTVDSESTASVKIVPTVNEPKQVKMISSAYGNLLAYVTSGTLVTPVIKQELFLLNPSGAVMTNVHLSDTIYQYISATRSLNGGFMVCATSDNYPYISLFQVGDNGEAQLVKNITTTSGTNRNEPDIRTYNNEYLLLYQSYGSGYYIWKGDANGVEILNKKIPPPASNHYGTGLNYGEKMVRLVQANDTMIAIQGINYDQYNEVIENCFVRAVSNTIAKKWYSTNYDSAHFEMSSGLFYSPTEQIVLFASRSKQSIDENYGDAFARTYSLSGTLLREVVFPRVGGTPNTIKNTIQSSDGGFIMVGSNNQLPANDLVSPNKIIVSKLNADLTVNWTKSFNTSFPSKGYDAAFLSDGSIAIIGLLKENLSTNKVLYLHLDANGNLINN